MSTNMTFGVETSTHRPKYRLWLGLYIITLYYFPKKSECSKNAHIPNLQTPYKRCSNGNTTAFKSCSDSFIVFRLFLIKHNVCVFGRVIHVCVELHFFTIFERVSECPVFTKPFAKFNYR